MVRTEQAEALLGAVKHLAAEARAYERLSAKAAAAPLEKSQKYSVDLAWAAKAVAVAEAAVHAAAVDAGLADLREPEHYAERKFRFGLGHEQLWLPAQPKVLVNAEAA